MTAVPFRVTEAAHLTPLPMFSVIVIGDRNGLVPGCIAAQKSVNDSWMIPGVPQSITSEQLAESTAYPFFADVVYVGEGLTDEVRDLLREGGFDV